MSFIYNIIYIKIIYIIVDECCVFSLGRTHDGEPGVPRADALDSCGVVPDAAQDVDEQRGGEGQVAEVAQPVGEPSHRRRHERLLDGRLQYMKGCAISLVHIVVSSGDVSTSKVAQPVRQPAHRRRHSAARQARRCPLLRPHMLQQNGNKRSSHTHPGDADEAQQPEAAQHIEHVKHVLGGALAVGADHNDLHSKGIHQSN